MVGFLTYVYKDYEFLVSEDVTVILEILLIDSRLYESQVNLLMDCYKWISVLFEFIDTTLFIELLLLNHY